jgi:hypothetical protein
MRGPDEASGSLFGYVDLEARIPAQHPLRKIRQVVNGALTSLDAEFEALYTRSHPQTNRFPLVARSPKADLIKRISYET